MSSYIPAIDLLKDKLSEYKKAKLKAEQSFSEGKIDKKTYDRYIFNLTPIILEYQNAVGMLIIYT